MLLAGMCTVVGSIYIGIDPSLVGLAITYSLQVREKMYEQFELKCFVNLAHFARLSRKQSWQRMSYNIMDLFRITGLSMIEAT